jgi:hypothetical protein
VLSRKVDGHARGAIYNDERLEGKEVSDVAKGKNMQKEKKKPKKTKK